MFATLGNRLIPKPITDRRETTAIHYFYQISVSIQSFEEIRKKIPSALKVERTLLDFFKLEKELLSDCKETQLLRPFENLLKLKLNKKCDSYSTSKSEYYHLYSHIESLSAYLNDLLTIPEIFSNSHVIKFLELPAILERR